MARPEILLRTLDAAALGERERGSDGVVLLDRAENAVSYVLLREIESFELRERLEEMLSAEGEDFFFVLERVDGSNHIWKISKLEAATGLLEGDMADGDGRRQ